jgi:hypothetical protein
VLRVSLAASQLGCGAIEPVKRGCAMLCLVCGAEMKLVQLVKDTRMSPSGYEHHTWQCSACPAVERRIDIPSGENAPPMQNDARKRVPSILCLECGGEMSLVDVLQDTAMFVPGYEHHTWRCSHCSRVEKRMTFTRTPTQVPAMERAGSVELTETAAEHPPADARACAESKAAEAFYRDHG